MFQTVDLAQKKRKGVRTSYFVKLLQQLATAAPSQTLMGRGRAKDRFSRWGFVASALLHVGFCALTWHLPAPKRLPSPQEEGIRVEIVNLPTPTQQSPEPELQPLLHAREEEVVSARKSDDDAAGVGKG